MEDCYSFADFWKKNLEKTGRYIAQEILLNVEPLQKKWAEENGIKYSEENWLIEILNAQISIFRPNVIFSHDLQYITPEVRLDLKKQNPSIQLIFGWDGITAHNPKKFTGCDMMLSCVKETSEFYSQNGFIGYFFPFGFEKKILDKITPHRELYDVSFVGSLVLRNNFHANRLKFLSEISKIGKLKTWITNFPSIRHPFAKIWIWRARTMPVSQYLDAFRVATINNPAVYGIKMYQTLADSKITLNIHATKHAGNMRLLEATGVGTCLLTDDCENIRDYFEPDKEIVTYKDISDAIEKIKYLLKNEEKRKEIALAGQKRALEEYSLENRINTFAKFMEQYLNSNEKNY